MLLKTVLISSLLGIFTVFAGGCSKYKGYKPAEKLGESYSRNDLAYGTLDQGWNYETRMEWWFTNQGSRIIPYKWFVSLENAGDESLFRSDANMERFRFIPSHPDPKWNPDGLPIGFVADKESKRKYIGVTCAACHTGKLEYGERQIIVEGAPSHSDFNQFLEELLQSMQATAEDTDKLLRFANRVIDGNVTFPKVSKLKAELEHQADKLGKRLEVNKPPFPNDYARLDAFGNIFNMSAVFAINEPENVKPADAPVSYPVVWDTPQHDKLQWNGAAVNAGIGPLNRNIGEVIGVFGGLRVKEKKVFWSKKLRYRSHINVENLERLESILETLWSPEWPEDILPAIDLGKAGRGAIIYEQTCMSCHELIDREDPNRRITAKMIPLKVIGTDPKMVENIMTRTSKTGILEGHQLLPVTKYIPDFETIEPFESEVPTRKIVANQAMGVLREELGLKKFAMGVSDYIEAAKKNALYDDCAPDTDPDECLRPPRYKARPLNGIWASAPFLHNGSVPNLWELLKAPEQRVKKFHVGSWVMDPVHVGFIDKWEPATSEFDTTLPGNSNLGHNFGTHLSDAEKWDLIEYIKAL